jgi:hypothetical protein
MLGIFQQILTLLLSVQSLLSLYIQQGQKPGAGSFSEIWLGQATTAMKKNKPKLNI